MKRIFLDANIIIDYLDASARDHKTAVDAIRIIRQIKLAPYISPVTFVIAHYVLGKFVKDKVWLKQQFDLTFSAFTFTPIEPSFLGSIMKTHFPDLEDAVQHECALSVKAHAILTKDTEDFFDSKIPIVHPIDFVWRYNNPLS